MCQLLKLWENASVPGMWHVAFFWQILDKPQMISEYISCHLCHLSKKPKENRPWNCSFYLQPILKRYLKSPAFSCQSQGQITPNACPQNCLGSLNSLMTCTSNLHAYFKRSIFQTFWKLHCCPNFLFNELETSNCGYLLFFL